MEQIPNCPKCQSEYTYEDGTMFVCPECAYEWSASEDVSAELEEVIKDANGNIINTVEKGDIITYKKNAEGNVEEAIIYHDYSVNKGKPSVEEQGWIKGDAAQQDDQRTVCAYVKRYFDGIVFLRYPNAASNKPFSADEMTGTALFKHDYAAPIMGGTAWIFDGREVKSATLKDYIESAEMLGFENSRPCYLTVNISRVNGGIFYTNVD